MSYSKINNMTEIRRAQLEKQLDNFATFKWGGIDMFKNFGVFIINDKKGSLKFYNGPSFSNEYSKPQFSSNSGDLIGVNFNRQTISFTVGVYWISAQDYRRLIACLDPLITDYIIFNFEPNYRYNVKLSKIGDSTRWVIGHENGEPRYYTELSLTFDLQGEQCAKGVSSYEMSWSNSSIINEGATIRKEMRIKKDDFIYSDLDTPFEITIPFKLVSEDPVKSDTIEYSVEYDYKDNKGNLVETKSIILFTINIEKLRYVGVSDSEMSNVETFNIRYNSETGLLFLKIADSNEKLISLLTTIDSGEKIVKNYFSTKFNIPGLFNFSEFKREDLRFILTYTREWEPENSNQKYISTQEEECIFKDWNPTFECYPRTNVI